MKELDCWYRFVWLEAEKGMILFGGGGTRETTAAIGKEAGTLIHGMGSCFSLGCY